MNKELVSQVLENLSGKEFGNKPLPTIGQLSQRLNELLEGRKIPVVVFQCIDFEWMADEEGKYPKALAKTDLSTPICSFYEEGILEVTSKLSTLGTPQLLIIIPDSELYDDRPFSFAQSIKERQELATNFRIELPKLLPRICNEVGTVILWSDYCKSFGLASPSEYTTTNFDKIKQDPKLAKKVRDQAKDSRRFFIRNGLNATYMTTIPDEEMEERVGWYCAMYAGEGQALLESGAITVNLEDGRVPAWFQRGAANLLPILSPVDPNAFYAWRRSIKI